jgi:hypothetical protein
MTYDTSAPNGILFSQDERTLYVVQSDYQGVRDLRAYPLQDDDTLGHCRVLYRFGEDFRGVHRGLDGMCLDTEGNILACGGWRQAGPGPMIYVFSPAGRVLETHPVPVDRPTNCTFGDPAISTTSRALSEGTWRLIGTKDARFDPHPKDPTPFMHDLFGHGFSVLLPDNDHMRISDMHFWRRIGRDQLLKLPHVRLGVWDTHVHTLSL